jgi:hypothetical protein
VKIRRLNAAKTSQTKKDCQHAVKESNFDIVSVSGNNVTKRKPGDTR